MFKVGDEVYVPVKILEHDRTYNDYKVEFVNGAFGRYDDSFLSDVHGKTYEQGLADAWELVRKLEALEPDERVEMFSYCSVKAIIEDCTIEEVMDKIETHEKEKEIKVGDEVRTTCGDTYWIIGITDSYIFGYLSDTKRNMFPVQKLEGLRLTKTGRTTDSIDLLGR